MFTRFFHRLGLFTKPNSTHQRGASVRPLPNPVPIAKDEPYGAQPFGTKWAVTRRGLVVWPELSESEAKGMARTMNGLQTDLETKAKATEGQSSATA